MNKQIVLRRCRKALKTKEMVLRSDGADQYYIMLAYADVIQAGPLRLTEVMRYIGGALEAEADMLEGRTK